MNAILKTKTSAIVIWGIIVVLVSFLLTGSLVGSVLGYVGGLLYEPSTLLIVKIFEKLANAEIEVK